MRPLQYAVYKGTGGKFGAVQFTLQPPHFYSLDSTGTRRTIKDFTGEIALDSSDGRNHLRENWRLREGAVFLEITSTKGPNIYDWENKITIALSINDIGQVLFTLLTGEDCKLMHDPNARTERQGTITKSLGITSPKGTMTGIIISASETSGGERKAHSVPLTGYEVINLRALLQAAIPATLAWG